VVRKRLEKAVLLGPAPVRRAAAAGAEPREAWMLKQPRKVRASYAREVMNQDGDPDRLAEIWMLRQPDEVRESYIEDVLR
jgi:hypothetical protein